MTPDEFAAEMESIAKLKGIDSEERHCKADSLVAQALQDLGYDDGIQIYTFMEKGYR
jgi:hypothetical protein